MRWSLFPAGEGGRVDGGDYRDTKTTSSGKRHRRKKWYAAGLAFECHQSGNCCSGAPGYVWVTKAEIQAIARHLGKAEGWLGKEHLRRPGFRYSLTEKPGGDCVFLDRREGKTFCKIHKVKPNQCQTWPFWSSNLRTPEHWNEASRTCPGMNCGATHSFVEIETLRRQRAPS